MKYTVSWVYNGKSFYAGFDSYISALEFHWRLEAMNMKPSLHER